MDSMRIEVSEDVSALLGARLFDKRGSQIVARDVLLEIQRTLSFSERTLQDAEHVVVFAFPLNGWSAKLLSERPVASNLTIVYKEVE